MFHLNNLNLEKNKIIFVIYQMAKNQYVPLQYRRRTFVIFTWSLFYVMILPQSTWASTQFDCTSSQFKCTDGTCIVREKLCDGHQDCSDNSDELDCDMKLCRKPNWFQCAQPHGPCLSAELVCNGVQNCPGGEDEVECVGRSRGGSRRTDSPSIAFDIGTGGWHTLKRNCSDFEYTCQTDKSCIPLDFMCDGKADCHDGSDEIAGCDKAEASCHGFFCGNKKCLESKKWVCDDVDDCGDGSDERNCSSKCQLSLGKFLCHDNITCLDISKACDGTPNCPDGSDEFNHCTSSQQNCSTKTCPPAAKCHMLPQSGPECLCPNGFRLSLHQNACVDINECIEQYGICSQGCENLAGTYRCTCDEGYTMRSDNKTCAVQNDEALLFYSTQIAVMGVHLESKRVYTVAKNLTKVIGIAYDSSSIYWTNIQSDDVSIVKANPDGSQQDILLTSGIDAPEDLAVDWLTGNIYFSDNVMRHIAVCSNDGITCAVLMTIDVHQPRGVALWPSHGQMFWTDWGTKPMIARASMDGSNYAPIVTDNIHWPNGIAVDMHNNRLYWVDAKFATMESARPDGTERRVVLGEIMKHPYGIAVFEDNIYWSDWGTKSIHMCQKFTGKNHKIITKDRTIYAVHIYHPAKQPKKKDHACVNTRCSHLCLLAENNTSTCACPDGMQLMPNQQRCVKTHKKQRIYIGIKNTLLEMEHTTFGRHVISRSHQLPMYINEMAYNSVNGSIFVADNYQRTIFEFDVVNDKVTTLATGNLRNVTGLAFDYLSHSLYWTDSERHVVEVLSLQTLNRAIVSFFHGVESPIGIAVVPEDGIMFVALRSRRHVHIDQLPLSGRGEHIHVFEDELGDDDVKFAVDYTTKTLYFSDSDLGRISFTDIRNMKAYTFRGRLKRPYTLAIVDTDLFWSEEKTPMIHWTHKNNLGPVKHVQIEVSDVRSHKFPPHIPLMASTSKQYADHPCQQSNGDCSHVCITESKFSASCLCPAGLVFKNSRNRTCIESLDCEFRCHSGECLTQSRRCNGRKDCPDGSDEESCSANESKSSKVICLMGEFKCHNADQCIDTEKRCDGKKDCNDESDEMHCDNFDKSKKCHNHQFACDNGNCVDFSVMCDEVDDCGDNSDESNCKVLENQGNNTRFVCEKNMFQCNSGTCIAKSWECDGKIDCTDGSDEHEKCDLKDCPAEMHRCLLGQCIDMRLVCDGNNDCGDYSDELNCDGQKKTVSVTCGDDKTKMYQCSSNTSVCLDIAAKCNGTAECPRGEDEADCGYVCSIYEFQCKTSKECIRAEFRCDHDKDCEDGSDELNCEHGRNGSATVGGSHERACEENMYDCKDGHCVDMTRVCDGFSDCDTGADEGPLCMSACRGLFSRQQFCEHKCRPTPSGAVCSCFHGYKLDDDKRSCVDINECVEFDPCAQLCENTHGSYRCSCYPDFMLRPDKTTCKSIESNATLLFSTYNEVRSMSEQPIVLKVAWSANDTKVNGFDVNVRKRKAYFSTESENVLYMVDMTNGTIKAAMALEMPSKVAVDWITDNVYVITRSQSYEITSCSFAAKMCGRIVQANPRETIKALAVDAFNRRLFYVIIRAHTFGAPYSQINIAHLDGRKYEKLLIKAGSYITAIATDPHKQLLYYVDVHTKTLQSINYRAGSEREVKTLIQKSNALLHPAGLTVYENQAFIVNIGAKEASRCHLYGARSCKAFNLNILNAEDVVIDGASRQPTAVNPCNMAKCFGLCIQADYGYECLCGNDIVTENTVCSKETFNELASDFLDSIRSQAQESDLNHTHVAVIVTLILLLILAIGAGVGYFFFYRRNKLGHRDFNINLHFQNLLSSSPSESGKSPPIYSQEDNPTVSSRNHQRKKVPIYKAFRGSTSNAGSEVHFETTKSIEFHKTEPIQRMPSIMVEEDSDNDTTRTVGPYEDDANVRLVN